MIKTRDKIKNYISDVLMLNIGLFLAYGLFTSIFIYPGGWIPNEFLSAMRILFLNILIPIMLASQGGKIFGGPRASVVACAAVLGCIGYDFAQYVFGLSLVAGQQSFSHIAFVSDIAVRISTVPMIVFSIIVGPLSGLIVNKIDELRMHKIKSQSRMYFDYFSVGIIGLILAVVFFILAYVIFNFVVYFIEDLLVKMIHANMTILTPILSDPLKVLFLNDELDKSIYYFVGQEELKNYAGSIVYLICTNPGPGLGVLIAYIIFAKDRLIKVSASGAIVIEFLGGIHEIYFPYVLINPIIIIGPILGNIASLTFWSLTGVGLNEMPMPGSIFSLVRCCPQDQLFLLFVGIVISTAISFLVVFPFIRRSNNRSLEAVGIEENKYQEKVQKEKELLKKGSILNKLTAMQNEKININPLSVSTIYYVCPTGIGFSAMGANIFSKQLNKYRPDIDVNYFSIDNFPSSADIVICINDTLKEVKKNASKFTTVLGVENFIKDNSIDLLGELLLSVTEEQAREWKEEQNIKFTPDGIKLNQYAADKYEAIMAAGMLLKSMGHVDSEYIVSMEAREKDSTTYIGNGVVLAHGITRGPQDIISSGVVLLQYPNGVKFNDETAELVFGIACSGDEHIDVIARISKVLEDEETLKMLKTTNNVDDVIKAFSE